MGRARLHPFSARRALRMFVVLLALHLSAGLLRAQAGGPPASRPIGSINFGGRGDATHTPNLRTILGFVQDANGHHLSGALVYLKDTHTSKVVVVNADDQGAYQFGALPLTEDYQVWAIVDGKQSPVRPISSFLTDKSVTIVLKVDTSTPAPPKP